ncbi:MAG: MoaD/ThiS family protein [Parasphingorhabdus sp.]|nr:MoaD/ThiS family protein [Parasphingorhabdus sp.]
MAQIKLLFFGWVKERVGTGEQVEVVPDGIATVGEFVDFLMREDLAFARLQKDASRLRFAADLEMVGREAALAGVSELAIFPPVTGG